MTDRGPLAALFDPSSLAIVGASDDPAKWGNWLAHNALRGAHRRTVYLVNRRGGTVAGQPLYASVRDLPEARGDGRARRAGQARPKPPSTTPWRAGSRVLVAITAGFGELGGDGRRAPGTPGGEGARRRGAPAGAELHGGLRRRGGVVRGQLGGGDRADRADLAERQPRYRAGHPARAGRARVLPLRLVGNQADIEAEEVLETLIDHAETRAIILYLEGIRDGRAAGGRGAAGARGGQAGRADRRRGRARPRRSAARSHTGALASGAAAIGAACRAGGMVEVFSPRQAVAAIQVLLPQARPTGPRLGIVADGGGHGVLAADLAAAAGLTVPALTTADGRGGGGASPRHREHGQSGRHGRRRRAGFLLLRPVVEALLGSGEVDAVLLTGFFGGYSVKSEELGQRELAAARHMADARDASRPRHCWCSRCTSTPCRTTPCAQREVPVFAAAEDGIEALARAVRWRDLPPAPRPLPPPAPPVIEDDYWTARTLLAEAGLPVAAARLVDRRRATGRAADCAFRSSPRRSGCGTSRTRAGWYSASRTRPSWRRRSPICARGWRRPRSRSRSRRRCADGVELIVGCRHDPSFGVLLLVGLGGIYAEIMQDTAVALGPIDAAASGSR